MSLRMDSPGRVCNATAVVRSIGDIRTADGVTCMHAAAEWSIERTPVLRLLVAAGLPLDRETTAPYTFRMCERDVRVPQSSTCLGVALLARNAGAVELLLAHATPQQITAEEQKALALPPHAQSPSLHDPAEQAAGSADTQGQSSRVVLHPMDRTSRKSRFVHSDMEEVEGDVWSQ
jgi:hypothetical protein